MEEVAYNFVKRMPPSTRAVLFDDFQNLRHRIREQCGNGLLEVWLNGSFISTKGEPADIDAVFHIKDTTLQDHGSFLLNELQKSRGQAVDGYILRVYPDDHKRHFRTTSDRAYWEHLFSRTKPTRTRRGFAKGFIKIQEV